MTKVKKIAVTKQVAKEEPDPGFTVLDAGTTKVRFHVYDNDLREGLANVGIIDWDYHYNSGDNQERKDRMDKRAIFPITYFLMQQSPKSIRKHITENVSEWMNELFAAIGEQLDALQKIVQQQYADTGTATFGFLTLVLLPDTLVVVNREGVLHGAKIVDVIAEDSTMYGKYYHVKLKIVTANATGFEYSIIDKYIMNYQDEKTTEELGFISITSELKDFLIARGRKYVELSSAPTLKSYNSHITRRNEYGKASATAIGRIMIDYAAMRTMDPTYDEYYGGVKNVAVNAYGNASKLSFGAIDLSDPAQLVICSPYLYGFSFRSTNWGEFTVENVTDINFKDQAYDKLVLDENIKRIILALVTYNSRMTNQIDLVDFKGGGCSFLLDGNPGIGKTLTAETLAEKLHVPLYSVSSGELGTTPEELSYRLKAVLDMAAKWNAILLIDEADVFLQKRDDKDIVRNAMVAIFLCLIEYYPGVLFMTTNRLDVIDPAFHSRISLSLHFPDLDEASRIQVWQNLLALTDISLDTVDINTFAETPLNGRNIKHVVRLASILAFGENRPLVGHDVETIMNVNSGFTLDKSEKTDTPRDLLCG